MAKQVANRRNQAHIQESKNSVEKGEKNERKNIVECGRVEEGMKCSSEQKDSTSNSMPIESRKKKHQIMGKYITNFFERVPINNSSKTRGKKVREREREEILFLKALNFQFQLKHH